ncbi:ATP-dependent DNA/RNA helicase dhx36 [Borealophlyctis nickersoniae]|nr:ATP-dependent DNA/RNA helicase dhx36 [Borealophlyctis nickersoniae]
MSRVLVTAEIPTVKAALGQTAIGKAAMEEAVTTEPDTTETATQADTVPVTEETRATALLGTVAQVVVDRRMPIKQWTLGRMEARIGGTTRTAKVLSVGVAQVEVEEVQAANFNVSVQYVQKYFSLFKAMVDFEYKTRPGGAIVARVQMPMPDGAVPVHMEASGKNSKDARANLFRLLKEKLDREKLMQAAEAEKANRVARTSGRGNASGSGGGTSSRGGPVNGATSRKRDRVDAWERDARPIAPIRPPPQASTRSAWDDDDDLSTPQPTSTKPNTNAFERSYPSDASSGRWTSSASASQSSPSRSTYDSTGQFKQPRPPRDDRHSFVRPPPPPNAMLPPMADVERKFVQHYCGHCQIVLPRPASQQLRSTGRFSSGNGKWLVRLRLPPHMFEGQQVSLEGNGLAYTKKDATAQAWANLTGHLLATVSQSFVNGFTAQAMPFKERLRHLLSEPLRVDFTEALTHRLDNMLTKLKSADAFQISESEKAALSHADDHVVLEGGLGSPPRLNQHQPYVRPSQIDIPPALENNTLPIFTQFREIMTAIDSSPVTILSAETGAGKTTQLPQFILEHSKYQARIARREGYPEPPVAQAVITQPRRIAAISVAQRVASERGETVGRNSVVGYQVRFESKRPTAGVGDGSIVFCTSGILLNRFQDDPELRGVTHVILDEVHERDLNTDLLLVVVRELLRKRSDIKVILMSATAETELFRDYFRGFGCEGPQRDPPIIKVPGRLFPVEEHHLEDVMRILNDPRALPRSMTLSYETNKFVRAELDEYRAPTSVVRPGEDAVPLDLIEAMIAHICTTRPPGAILVFLPGWQEINTLQQSMKEVDTYRVGFADPKKYKVVPLHSSVPMSAQQEVFAKMEEGVRKVILSTNIAETSVTINDIVYVIDSGKMRQNSYDADRRVSSLASVWGSQSNLRQRIGRAGRCQPGLYFTVMSRRRHRTLPYSMPPELLRVDLQSTVLKIKSLHLSRHCADVFRAAPQPPSPGSVQMALEELSNLGAIDERERLTPLGQVLSNMPVDPWIGKMVLEGAVLGVLDPVLTIAGAIENGRGIYAIHPDEKQTAREHIIRAFAGGTESDQLTMLTAFNAWKGMNRSREFAVDNYLHFNSLVNIDKAKVQLSRVLEDCGFLVRDPRARYDDLMGGKELNEFSEDMKMVRAVLCGALYPNVAEVCGKDEYKAGTGGKMRLTGSTVNCWRGVSTPNSSSSSAAATTRSSRPQFPGFPSSANDTASVSSDFDVPDQDDTASTCGDTDISVPLPPRLLTYQDKQRVDGGLYMRTTTRADPIALLLFGNSRDVYWTRSSGSGTVSRPAAVMDGWIRIEVGDERRARVVQECREWVARYLEWCVWRRVKGLEDGSEEEVLGREFVREVVTLVGAAVDGE